MATASTDFMTDSFKQMSDCLAGTLEVGTDFFQRTAEFWTDAAAKNAQTFRKQWETFNGQAAPLARSNIERLQKLFEQQCQRGLELMRLNVDTQPTADPAELFDRTVELWRNSFETLRQSIDAVAKANAQMFESWTELIGAPAAGVRTAKATARKAAK